MSERPDAQAAANQFKFRGEVLSLTPHGSGHINDTYLVTCQGPGAPVRYILQHINRHVFHDPIAVMENVGARHGASCSASCKATRRLTPRTSPCSGAGRTRLARGCARRNVACLSVIIENARSYETATSTGQALCRPRAPSVISSNN